MILVLEINFCIRSKAPKSYLSSWKWSHCMNLISYLFYRYTVNSCHLARPSQVRKSYISNKMLLTIFVTLHTNCQHLRKTESTEHPRIGITIEKTALHTKTTTDCKDYFLWSKYLTASPLTTVGYYRNHSIIVYWKKIARKELSNFQAEASFSKQY